MAEGAESPYPAKYDTIERDVEAKPSVPVDDMITWIDRTQDELSLTMDRLERALGAVLGEEHPRESDERMMARRGSSPLVNRLSSLGMRGEDLNLRLSRLIDRVEV